MMKRLWSLGFLCILMTMVALPALAGTWKLGHGDMRIPKGDVVRGDLYFSGEYLEIDGEVQGDLLVAAGEVKINGKINGSLLGLIAEKLTVNGLIGEDLRVAAGKIEINGTVGESISSVAAVAELFPKSVAGKGIIGIFNQLKLSGRVDGPVRVSGYTLTELGGVINGDVQVRGVPVTWEKKATINGNFDDYSGGSNTGVATHGKISGEYRIHQDTESMMKVLKTLLIFSLIWFLGSVLIALIFY
jgi:cytoskeletal protein CcmA (bactofilin family)